MQSETVDRKFHYFNIFTDDDICVSILLWYYAGDKEKSQLRGSCCCCCCCQGIMKKIVDFFLFGYFDCRYTIICQAATFI